MTSRIAYYLGHYTDGLSTAAVNENDSSSSNSDSLRDSIFNWKCAATQSVVGARAPVPALPGNLPLPVKQALALWSKGLFAVSGASSGSIDTGSWFRVVEGVAQDPAVDEVGAEAVYLSAAESFIATERWEEAFSVLKRLKASSIDG